MSTAGNSSQKAGLVISVSESIRSFLLSSSRDRTLSLQVQEIALKLSSQSNAPYKLIRDVWIASNPKTRPQLTRLFSGSEFVFLSPKPREKSEELKARLRKLEELAERKAYQELVKDIAPKRDVEEPFSSYKNQLGFGLHVALIMFTGYLVGYAGFRALFNHNPAMNAAGGILGLVGGMLVETLLFIIRTSSMDRRRSSSTRSQLKKNQ